LINAAAALALARGIGLKEAGELARQTIDSGRARNCLEGWRAAAKAKSPSGTP
jgi:anthranilate phosphoribosyltransferase